jgi:hypothetical protein
MTLEALSLPVTFALGLCQGLILISVVPWMCSPVGQFYVRYFMLMPVVRVVVLGKVCVNCFSEADAASRVTCSWNE